MATALFAVITAIPGVVWFALFSAERVLWAQCQEWRKQWREGLETGGLSQSHDLFHCSVQLTLWGISHAHPGQAMGKLQAEITSLYCWGVLKSLSSR